MSKATEARKQHEHRRDHQRSGHDAERRRGKFSSPARPCPDGRPGRRPRAWTCANSSQPRSTCQSLGSWRCPRSPAARVVAFPWARKRITAPRLTVRSRRSTAPGAIRTDPSPARSRLTLSSNTAPRTWRRRPASPRTRPSPTWPLSCRRSGGGRTRTAGRVRVLDNPVHGRAARLRGPTQRSPQEPPSAVGASLICAEIWIRDARDRSPEQAQEGAHEGEETWS